MMKLYIHICVYTNIHARAFPLPASFHLQVSRIREQEPNEEKPKPTANHNFRSEIFLEGLNLIT